MFFYTPLENGRPKILDKSKNKGGGSLNYKYFIRVQTDTNEYIRLYLSVYKRIYTNICPPLPLMRRGLKYLDSYFQPRIKQGGERGAHCIRSIAPPLERGVALFLGGGQTPREGGLSVVCVGYKLFEAV
jgi:hypothetical protein